MKKRLKEKPPYRLLKAGCVGAGLLSITNPTQVTAADLGIFDLTSPDLTFSSFANPFPRSPMGVTIAAGDLDDDGVAEIILGRGRGTTQLAIVDDFCCLKLKSPGFSKQATPSGLSVATGDLDGDGRAEILVGSASGASSSGAFLEYGDHLKGRIGVVTSFDKIFDGFSGGVSLASGNLDSDPELEFLAARKGRVNKVDSFTIKMSNASYDGWDPFESQPPVVGGMDIAMGDVDGDGLADILAVPSSPPPGTPLSPYLYHTKQKKWLTVENWEEPAGVHVAMGDVDGDGLADLVVGSAVGASPYIQGYTIKLDIPNLVTLPKITPKISKESHGRFFVGYDEQGVRVAVGDIAGDGGAMDIVFAQASVPEPTTIASLFVALGAWLVGGGRRRRDGSPPG